MHFLTRINEDHDSVLTRIDPDGVNAAIALPRFGNPGGCVPQVLRGVLDVDEVNN